MKSRWWIIAFRSLSGPKLLHTNFTGFGAEPSVRLLWTPNARQTVLGGLYPCLANPSDAEENFYLLGIGRHAFERHALFGALQRQSRFRAGTA